jgi:hypothetical protein
MNKLIFTLLMLSFGYSAMFAQASKRIAFLHDPTTAVAQSGLMANLRLAGYAVDSFYKTDAGVFDYVALAGYDLVIVSKGVSSPDFVDSAAWDTMKVPVLITSVQATRSSRMQLINTTNVITPTPAQMTAWNVNQITDALAIPNSDGTTYDSVFLGVTKGGVFPFYKWAYIVPDYYYSDWKLDKLTGKLLVVMPDTASWGADAIIMARWSPGTVPYKGAGIHAGWVSYMDIGADDDHLQINYDNYTTESLKLFMNEVAYLIKQKSGSTGISKLAIPSQFNVYPNPSSNGIFNIDINEVKSQTTNIQIYSLTGQLVYAKEFMSKGSISINSGLEKGMYFMSVNIDGIISTRKIVIR